MTSTVSAKVTRSTAGIRKPAFHFLKGVLQNPFSASLFIFAFAFGLRWLYNCVWLEHRVCHVGDAYNFLRSGTALLGAIMSSHSLGEFLQQAVAPGATAFNPIQSMSSSALSDRLSIDGPVFPSYLALIEWLCGINPQNPIFDNKITQMSLCNAVLDSFQCLFMYACGRLAFNKRTGLIAGLLFAVYPGAIINTQHCYSEPVSYFILTAWTALILRLNLRHVETTIGTWLALGFTTGMLMLSKPAFVLLPILMGAYFSIRRLVLISKRQATFSLSKLRMPATGFAIGASALLLPWLVFNKVVTGQISLFVNRVPAFNLFHGNQISTDGWRIHPFNGYYPGDMSLVVQSLVNTATAHPLPFAAMELKKFARLWAGVWNEFQYQPFGFTLEAQYIFHQALIFLAVIGLSSIISTVAIQRSWAAVYRSRSLNAAIVFSLIAFFHFSYLPFETISRYGITAMPALILLASFTIDQTLTRRRVAELSALIIVAAGTFSVLLNSGNLTQLLASSLPAPACESAALVSWCLSAMALVLLFLLSAQYLKTPDARANGLALLPVAFAANLVLLSSLACATANHESREWFAPLQTGQNITQSLHLPADAEIYKAPVAFALIDMTSSQPAPNIELSVNGVPFVCKPFPLAQLQPNNEDIVQCLAIQGQAMAKDMRTFRHWWLAPLPSKLLKGNADNQITIVNQGAPIRIYGDRLPAGSESASSDGIQTLPSLTSYCYTKGFSTFDHRDPRTYEPTNLLGKTRSDSTQDLSSEPGMQTGRYRIRILSCNSTSLPSNDESPLFSKEIIGTAPALVAGENPLSFTPPNTPITLPEGLPANSRVAFTCDINAVKGLQPCFASVTLRGTDANNNSVSWNSAWQPASIAVNKTNWVTASFTDIIPKHILESNNLRADILVSPFQSDFLFLKRKDAMRCRIAIRNMKFDILQPLAIPDNRVWQIY